jgi:hypothetical protein
MQEQPAQPNPHDCCTLRLPQQKQTQKGNHMHTQSQTRAHSGNRTRTPKDVDAEMKEEDDFMLRHGWYMSCFYEAWRNGRGRAVEKKRASERAKWVRYYRGSTICPSFDKVGVAHSS